MSDLIWRIRFAIRVSWICRASWWEFKSLYLGLGWKASAQINQELRDMSPEKAALEEMTRWYTE